MPENYFHFDNYEFSNEWVRFHKEEYSEVFAVLSLFLLTGVSVKVVEGQFICDLRTKGFQLVKLI